MFASLINANPDEIAFVLSTTDSENLVVAGLGLVERGGNVVIDDLHFAASRYLYTALEAAGHVELRVVPHRDWKIDIGDMERAIDRDTRLVSMALVSNINGYMHDARAVSEIAHAHVPTSTPTSSRRPGTPRLTCGRWGSTVARAVPTSG